MRLTFNLCFVFTFVALLSCAQKKKEAQPAANKPVVNDLPAMPILFADGTQRSVKELTGKTVLVLFFPDCDHCQREAEQIRKNLEAFKDYNLYFISSAPLPEIEKFSVDYQLKGAHAVHFAQTAPENVIASFGPIETPSLYIYSTEGRLVQSFNGEVDISVVLKYL